MTTNYKTELTKEIKDLIISKIFVGSKKETLLFLENSHLDFSSRYIFMGFSGKTRVILGTDTGMRIIKRFGYVAKTDSGALSLWTDGYRYSLRISKGDFQ